MVHSQSTHRRQILKNTLYCRYSTVIFFKFCQHSGDAMQCHFLRENFIPENENGQKNCVERKVACYEIFNQERCKKICKKNRTCCNRCIKKIFNGESVKKFAKKIERVAIAVSKKIFNGESLSEQHQRLHQTR
jgi:hypothetical protein